MENTFDELDKMNLEVAEEDKELEYEYAYSLSKEEGDMLQETLLSVARELTLLRETVSKMQQSSSTENIVDLVFAKIQEARKAYVRPTAKQAPGRPVREPTKTKVPKVKKVKAVKKAKVKKAKVKKTKAKKVVAKKTVKKTKAKKVVKSKPSSKVGKSKKR